MHTAAMMSFKAPLQAGSVSGNGRVWIVDAGYAVGIICL
jgi:hypothetical protein